MTIKQRLDIKQGQSLTMTPQMQQAIKLLQMSNLELAEFVAEELEKNPLLERDDGTTAQEETPVEDNQKNKDTAPPDEGDIFNPAEDARNLDADFDNVFTGNAASESQYGEGGYDAFATNEFAGTGKGGSSKFENPEYSFENTMAEEKTLRDHLLDQMQLEFEDPKICGIAMLLLDTLDESGYCRADLNELSDRLGCEIAEVEDVLARMQKLDPPGIFARDLSECLALQLRDKNRLDPAMQKLLDNLDLLGKHEMDKLLSLCDVDAEDLAGMVEEIKSLDPKPALAFDHFVSQTVIPDVLMRPLPKSKGGGWTVELNNDTLPRVLFNQRYHAEISTSAKSKEDREYLNTQTSTANWLIKAMDQRAKTIMKTAIAIIQKQEAFFNYGVAFLKPLVLKDIAEEIEMHESTVSRVTNNKYIGTPRGVFELKYFFSSGVGGADGGASVSSESVKARIKALTAAEDPGNILSDDDLVKALKAEGIDLARRTVAKYREAMKIPSSVQRRRAKKKQ